MNNRKVTKYTAMSGSLVWVMIKNKWQKGIINRLVRNKIEVSFYDNKNQPQIILCKYDDLIYRKKDEIDPPKEV